MSWAFFIVFSCISLGLLGFVPLPNLRFFNLEERDPSIEREQEKFGNGCGEICAPVRRRH